MKQFAVMLLSVYKSICNKVRELLNITDTIKADELPEKINEVYEAGKKAEYDRFWDAYQDYGNRRDYSNAFYNRWNDATFNPKYDIVATAAYGTFAYSVMTNINVTADVSSAKNDGILFSSNARLETIKKVIVSDINTFSNWFIYCSSIKNVTFEGIIAQNGLNFQWSDNLTIESLRSIISCLKDYSTDTSGTVWQVTVGSINYAKLTTEDLENISKKGWVFV